MDGYSFPNVAYTVNVEKLCVRLPKRSSSTGGACDRNDDHRVFVLFHDLVVLPYSTDSTLMMHMVVPKSWTNTVFQTVWVIVGNARHDRRRCIVPEATIP